MESPPSPAPPPGGRLRRWIDRTLHGTLHHYRSTLPQTPGPILSRALALFYCGVRLEEPQRNALRELPAEAIVVYASKKKSDFAFLFAYSRYRAPGMRFPRIGLGGRFFIWQPPARMARILLAHLVGLLRQRRFPEPYGSGHLRAELLQDRAGFFTLIPERRFWWHFGRPPMDPVEFLITVQQTVDVPVLIVPQLMLFSKKPRRSQPSLIDMLFGPEDEPGRLRGLVALFKKRGQAFVEISEPIDLREFLDRPDIQPHGADYQAGILRGEILERFQRHHRSITGPVLKPRAELKESILAGDRFQQFLQTHADAQGIGLAEARAKAAEMIDEIAAAFSPNWILFYSGIVGWILNNLFDGLVMNPDELAAVKRMSLRGPLVFIPSHKSHVDYLLLSYVMYHHDLPCPLVAAGKNLSFWPLGPLFRRGGAFFIRRSFRGAVLYARTFAEYIHKVLEEGYNLEQFIEGGRSRTGKLLAPKLGLLSIILNAHRNGACRDLVFVPAAIAYDQVLEEKSYLQELGGGDKQPETLRQVLGARKFLKKRWGKVYLTFGAPFSLLDAAASESLSLSAAEPPEVNRFCRGLAQRIAHDINRVSVVTAQALAAAAILNGARERFAFAELMAVAEIYLAHLDAVGARLADTLLLDHRRAIAHAVNNCVQQKTLEALAAEPGEAADAAGFLLNESRRQVLDYYKNTCIAFFVPAACTALAILQRDAFQFSAADLPAEVEWLQQLFQHEFVFDRDTPAETQVRRMLALLVEDAVLIPHPSLPDSYNLTAAGYRKLKLFAMFLKTLLESYAIVLHYLMQTPHDAAAGKERIRKIAALGSRMLKRKEIDHPEALSRIAYENALQYFGAIGIQGAADREKASAAAALIQRALTHLAP
ncbi:MAG: 1-acyl-sn-glycerol-3-phosphate acyltransferase [Desulfobacterales bacterium]|jgi:glycerol-3-phosphate O-acyltransferase|nr:1-acyl-sn-glycerol-3-phosphate acyltransferase [Desulfobacterales bacterium]